MSATPNILDVLGSYRSSRTRRLSDEHLKTLHTYLFMCLLGSDEEMKRRGLRNGEEVRLSIARPE